MTGSRVELRCPSCGSNQFRYPTGRPLQDSDAVQCTRCGRHDTVGKLKKGSVKNLQKTLKDVFGDRFKPRR